MGRDTAQHDRPTRVRFIVSGALAASAAIAYLCRTSLAVAEETIRDELGISEASMGVVLGPAFFWSYALAQIPTGWLGQRFGSRLMLPLFVVLSSVATAWFGLANTLVALLVARLAMGVAQAGLFPCSTMTIANWHPLSERARASGVLGAAMSFGQGIGLALTGVTMAAIGWRNTFEAYALPGIAWAVLFAAWFRNRPSEHRQANEAERRLVPETTPETHGQDQARIPWKAILGSGALWLIYGQQFFRAAGQVFFASWFVTYLRETRGVSLADSAWMTAVPVVAMFLASLTGGVVSDRVLAVTGSLTAARKGVATIALTLCALIVSSAYFVANPMLAVGVISIGMFCAGFGGPCAYAATIDVGGKHVAPVFGTMNMIGNFGAGLAPWLVPYYRVFIAGLIPGDGTVESWHAVLLFFAGMYLAAAICWMGVRLDGTGVGELGAQQHGDDSRDADDR